MVHENQNQSEVEKFPQVSKKKKRTKTDSSQLCVLVGYYLSVIDIGDLEKGRKMIYEEEEEEEEEEKEVMMEKIERIIKIEYEFSNYNTFSLPPPLKVI